MINWQCRLAASSTCRTAWHATLNPCCHVITRKVSFGSQSQEGAKTCEVLMSVLHTLKKRRLQAEQHLKSALDQLAVNAKQDPFPLLFSHDTS